MTHIGYSLTHNNDAGFDMVLLGVNMEYADPSADFDLPTICRPSHEEVTHPVPVMGILAI